MGQTSWRVGCLKEKGIRLIPGGGRRRKRLPNEQKIAVGRGSMADAGGEGRITGGWAQEPKNQNNRGTLREEYKVKNRIDGHLPGGNASFFDKKGEGTKNSTRKNT